ncbi:MAG: YihY/virulence factor BrkB family protein, partial [Chloroflexota bacterium]
MKTQIRRGWQFSREVIEKYVEHECPLRAASLAYYALFSIFPLLLFLVYLGSWFLTSEGARGTLDIYIQRVFPVSAEDIRAVVDQTILARGPIGVLGSVGLFWSASSVFGVLEWSLSVIWDGTPSPFWRTRLLAAVSVLALSTLFIFSFFLRPLVDWLWADDGIVYKEWLNTGVGIGAGVVISLLLFRIFPN